MNLDELRTVQSKERSKDSLQHLRESFYSEVGEYIADLKDQRERAAERAESQFDDPEVNRLTDEINTAEDVVEAIYERRVGKVVKRASLAAAGMPADEEGLTTEEQRLFAELVERIESNKEEVLDVLAGETDAAPTTDSTPTPADAPPADSSPAEAAPDPGEAAPSGARAGETTDAPETDVSAADVMGGTDAGDPDGEHSASAEAAAVADGTETSNEAAAASEAPPATERASDSDTDADDPLAGLAERTTVRITDDVGEIFGVDERTYDLESEDVVSLPEANAEPLVERGAAEELE